jgi:hypothetical protein
MFHCSLSTNWASSRLIPSRFSFAPFVNSTGRCEFWRPVWLARHRCRNVFWASSSIRPSTGISIATPAFIPWPKNLPSNSSRASWAPIFVLCNPIGDRPLSEPVTVKPRTWRIVEVV